MIRQDIEVHTKAGCGAVPCAEMDVEDDPCVRAGWSERQTPQQVVAIAAAS
jgi:hypothetical protein